jgi:hypothetical protein
MVALTRPQYHQGAAFFVAWVQRRYMLFYRLERIPRHSIVFKQDDAPAQVIELIQTEYLRVSAISHFSRPTTGGQPGWGVPGSKYDGVYFKRAFLDAVEKLGKPPFDVFHEIMYRLMVIQMPQQGSCYQPFRRYHLPLT